MSLYRAPRRILLASGCHTPNRIPDVIGNQQGTGLVDGQPDRPSAGLFIRVQEAGDDVLGFAARTPAAERHENDLVAVEAWPVPTAMFADEGAAAGATLLRSGDRTSFGSALRTRRRAEPDAVVKIGTYGPCAEFIKTAPIGSARMRRFYFNLVHHDEVEPIGHPVADRGQAIAVAQRLAIDIAENRQDCLGKGYSVSIVDDAGIEIHRESVDSAEKSG